MKHRRLELPPTMNDRLHYHAKARWVKEWRSAAYFTAKGRNLPRLERARVSMIIYRDRIGVADPDNDWGRAKPLFDGLRDAGALAKDTHKHLIIGSIEERRGDHGILLIVEEIADEPEVGGWISQRRDGRPACIEVRIEPATPTRAPGEG